MISLLAAMSDCSDLIGMPYRLGSDGRDGKIDCIHLCYVVLDRLGIPTPVFNHRWYRGIKREIARDLYAWGYRVHNPRYTDGDILLLPQDSLAFAVIWDTGVLYINRQLEKVQWSAVQSLIQPHCFRSRNSL